MIEKFEEKSLKAGTAFIVWYRDRSDIYLGPKLIGIRSTQEKAKRFIKFYKRCHEDALDSDFIIEKPDFVYKASSKKK